jgi:hypothetical protein
LSLFIYFISSITSYVILYKELYVHLYCLYLLHCKIVQVCSLISVVTLMLKESKVSTPFLTTHTLLPYISKNLQNA